MSDGVSKKKYTWLIRMICYTVTYLLSPALRDKKKSSFTVYKGSKIQITGD